MPKVMPHPLPQFSPHHACSQSANTAINVNKQCVATIQIPEAQEHPFNVG